MCKIILIKQENEARPVRCDQIVIETELTQTHTGLHTAQRDFHLQREMVPVSVKKL